MSYLMGSRALALHAPLKRPAADIDIVLTPGDLSKVAASTERFQAVPPIPGKYIASVNGEPVEISLCLLPSHKMIEAHPDLYLSDKTLHIGGLEIPALTLEALWAIKLGASFVPTHRAKTLADLTYLTPLLFGNDAPLLSIHAKALADAIKKEAQARLQYAPKSVTQIVTHSATLVG